MRHAPVEWAAPGVPVTFAAPLTIALGVAALAGLAALAARLWWIGAPRALADTARHVP